MRSSPGDYATLAHARADAGWRYWELGVRPWFPQPTLAGQFYTFHSVVHVKKPYIPFASGQTVRSWQPHSVRLPVGTPVRVAVVAGITPTLLVGDRAVTAPPLPT